MRFSKNGTLTNISKPLHESFRHTAHGSPFGTSWGSPAFLESQKGATAEVQMRSKTMDAKHGRAKSFHEHHIKERKGNAQKQFSYNKLINEQQRQQQMLQQQKNKNKPDRPPQPKVSTGHPREGNLIDLSPDELMSLSLQQQRGVGPRSNSDICILDEPIDVPTELDYFQEAAAITSVTPEPELQQIRPPPPYQAPPRYGTTHNDPFDTSHIAGSSQNTIENLYENYSKSANSNRPSNNNDILQENLYSNSEISNGNLVGAFNSLAIANNESPQIQIAEEPPVISETISINNKNLQMTPKKVDKTFLADLEKSIYKNQESLSVNLKSSLEMQQQSPTKYYDFTPFQQQQFQQLQEQQIQRTLNRGSLFGNETQQASAVSDFSSTSNSTSNSTGVLTNEWNGNSIEYGNSVSGPPKTKSVNVLANYNSTFNSGNMGNFNSGSLGNLSSGNSINFTNMSNLANMENVNSGSSMLNLGNSSGNYGIYGNDGNQGIYTNSNSLPLNGTTIYGSSNSNQIATLDTTTLEMLGNYEVATRPYEAPENIYNSIAGDIYGSIAGGNIYDTVTSSAASTYGQTSQIQQAIYDEVTAYEEMLRPIRPAPSVPSSGNTGLSQQQIIRRLEKIGQHQNKVVQLVNVHSEDNITEDEAKEALEKCNWDTGVASRHFKIERLAK